MAGVLRESTESDWTRAAVAIRQGALVVFPTDTVYGVGCDPFSEAAIRKVYRAKGRSELKAIPVLLSDAERLGNVGRDLPEAADILGAAFWPGALTLIVPRRPELPNVLSNGPTLAVRIPDHAGLRAMIRECGGAIAATSANRSGEPDATDAVTARRYLGDHVEMIVDDGPSPGGVPSTVVDCTQHPVRLLRVGSISATDIERVLGQRIEGPHVQD